MEKKRKDKGTTIRRKEAEIFCQLVSRLYTNRDVSILIRNPVFTNLCKKLLALRNRYEKQL